MDCLFVVAAPRLREDGGMDFVYLRESVSAGAIIEGDINKAYTGSMRDAARFRDQTMLNTKFGHSNMFFILLPVKISLV